MGLVNGWRAVQVEEMRFQSKGMMRKDFCPKFLQPLFENFDRRSCNDGRSQSQPSPRKLTHCFGSGSYLGVPCRGAFKANDEWEGVGQERNRLREPPAYFNLSGDKASPTTCDISEVTFTLNECCVPKFVVRVGVID